MFLKISYSSLTSVCSTERESEFFLSIIAPSHFFVFSYLATLKCLFQCTLLFSAFLFPHCSSLVFPAEPEEKQKDILNNTIPEGKDTGDLLVSRSCQCLFCCVTVTPLCILKFKSVLFYDMILCVFTLQ